MGRLKTLWIWLGHISLMQWLAVGTLSSAPLVLGFVENLPLAVTFTLVFAVVILALIGLRYIPSMKPNSSTTDVIGSKDAPDDTTLVNVDPSSPLARGSRNTVIGPTDSYGNIWLEGGTSIGAGAGYDPQGIIIGAGAAASLNARAQNGLDELDRRRRLIDACRDMIASWGDNAGHREQKREMERWAEFLALKRYLSDSFKRVFDQNPLAIINADRPDRPYLMGRLESELDRLEEEWGL